MAVVGNLIEQLSVGFTDAASGTVTVYQTGTTNAANVYSDAACTSLISPVSTATYSLTSAGRLTAYVNGEVDCIVKNSGGSTVATFTPSDAATNSAVSNSGFTGTTVDAILSAAYTSFGQQDWKVSVGGTSDYIKNHLSRVSGLYFNVKSSAYGATGNGSTDDTAAIQAAINAAAAAGGGIVFFPSGSYKITSALTYNTASQVAFQGSGMGLRQYGGNSSSQIKQATAGQATFALAGGALILRDLYLASTAVGQTSPFILDTGTTTVVDCFRVGTDLTTTSGSFWDGSGATSSSGIALRQCTAIIASASLLKPGSTASPSLTAIESCYLYGSAATTMVDLSTGTVAGSFARQVYIVGNVFYCNVTGTTCVKFGSANTDAWCSGNQILDTAGIAVTAWDLAGYGANGTFYEDGTLFRQNNASSRLYAASSSIASSRVRLRSREVSLTDGGTGASITPDITRELNTVVANAAFTVNAPAGSPSVYEGQSLVIIIQNTSGGALTPTFNAVYKLTSPSIANNQYGYFKFRYYATISKWMAETVLTYA